MIADFIGEIFQNVLVGDSAIVKAARDLNLPQALALVAAWSPNMGSKVGPTWTLYGTFIWVPATTRILIQILQTSPRADQ